VIVTANERQQWQLRTNYDKVESQKRYEPKAEDSVGRRYQAMINEDVTD
jgi:hypothetical protein